MRLATLALLRTGGVGWRLFGVSAMLAVAPVISAQPLGGSPESRLRDALLKHFAQDNLVPIFLARPHEVGDVLELTGAKYASRKDCFPTLVTKAPIMTDRLKTVVVNTAAEGNFGINLKRIYEIFAKAGASDKARMTLTFEDQMYVGVTTLDLEKAYAVAKCPQIRTVVHRQSVAGDQLPQPILMVLQEVYLARKKLVVELDRSAGVEAAAKEAADTAVSLGLSAQLKAGVDQSRQLIVESAQQVPVAVRIAFVPKPISGATLGGGGSAGIKGYVWEPAAGTPTAGDREALAVMERAIEAATRGKANPLLND